MTVGGGLVVLEQDIGAHVPHRRLRQNPVNRDPSVRKLLPYFDHARFPVVWRVEASNPTQIRDPVQFDYLRPSRSLLPLRRSDTSLQCDRPDPRLGL